MQNKKDKAAFICSRDTLDGAYPPLILAINCARQGMEAKVFYTFMGMNLAKREVMKNPSSFPPALWAPFPACHTWPPA